MKRAGALDAAASAVLPRDAEAMAAAAAAGEPRTYVLPDGQRVIVGTEGQQVAELLFRPSLRAGIRSSTLGGQLRPSSFSQLLKETDLSVAEAVIDSAQTETSFRRQALENLLVCGGGSCAPNVAKRLLKEVRGMCECVSA